ncbi:MAG TPA: UDP-N-acetylmuramoyl-L-alanyl-D-glutamate--2,6-diaminopimelate ligase [Candidatus Binatia bacterium]|nr:UDP-N-acetylmuramoyl-L-alanyl-D-glutamate--2,6-diaminopimelate ligase [Candidatus Binatia bacterium]
MILRDLLPAAAPVEVRGTVDVEISQLVYDSRLAKPGALFFALPGTKDDGARFIEQACERGARAVVVPPGTAVTRQVTTIFSDAPRVLLGLMADRFYHSPSARLTLVGVTGTSGKTTTTYLLEAIWQAMGWSAGVVGTVNYRYRGRELPAPFTTPEAVELQELLSAMAAHEVSHVAMEVSSHALAQERVRGCLWDGALFTNLGRDHLDFHRDLEDYFAAKSRLFLQALAASPKPRRFAAINADDPWGTRLLAAPIPGRVLTYGLQPGVTVSARDVRQSLQGLRGVLRLDGEEVPFSSALIGDPHLYNILAAATVAHALGVPAERIAAGVAQCTHVPGRLEAVSAGQPFTVLVDYAHKPDALEKVLRSVRRLTTHRLLTVFGCGGDRDRGKRPLMGEAAGRLSDVVILTSDNPRTEDPGHIIAEAEAGLVQAGQPKLAETVAVTGLRQGYVVIADRRTAIRTALAGAQPGDVVVIAGKGHEDYQIIGTTKHHFDDREEVRQYLQACYGGGRA